ncbi:MAG: 5-methyltetrahydropteroyltriglutamate--homocysteine S-methyltransferase [Bacteroidales bacterium]|nr:5-methyltetrahydropteroyltriglutamate--homocysteine S-methyltransferase [Bacteroidales bacterium]
MITHTLGYPRIGAHRELKFALEKYWKNEISVDDLLKIGETIRKYNWEKQQEAKIDLIPINDFSYYDHVLDTTLMLGNIPPRFRPFLESHSQNPMQLYFAMARGYQDEKYDIHAMEMTKWFNTNYHYIVPEFYTETCYQLLSEKVFEEFAEAQKEGFNPKPVLLGPVSYVLLGKIKDNRLSIFSILEGILPIYQQALLRLEQMGCKWVQLDEPMLATDLQPQHAELFQFAYHLLTSQLNSLSVLLATYFGDISHQLGLINQLPIDALHIDVVSAPTQLDELEHINPHIKLSLGIVDGRNIWKNDFEKSLKQIIAAMQIRGNDNLLLAPSCSLLHVPYDLSFENNPQALPNFVKEWMAFARQKLKELEILKALALDNKLENALAIEAFSANVKCMSERRQNTKIKNEEIRIKIRKIDEEKLGRKSPYAIRCAIQQQTFNLPVLPTTTIGSFPQTTEVRKMRNQFRKGQITESTYKRYLHNEIEKCVRSQEEVDLDVLVHGEFERNDMVEYFGEQLDGFAFTENGWVQSYGSRCVKPPVIYGDVSRPHAMTLEWACFAQSLTKKPMKGMLTGPLTILKWSFVRDDQPWFETLMQIALALNEEVLDLQSNGIKIIQIDEPALRESLPLRQKDWPSHLNHAIKAFHITVTGVEDSTQIHTHMCYSEFNDIIESIAQLDADVITIEASRSDMELLQAFKKFKYPNGIGPGIYDIHSPRIPAVEEMEKLIEKALEVIPVEQMWINPDCGLKTRNWKETMASLRNMVIAANNVRARLSNSQKIKCEKYFNQ